MREHRLFGVLAWAVASPCVPSLALADDLLNRYEGDINPCHLSTGWICGNPCDVLCADAVENGYYVLTWAGYSKIVGYGLWLSDGAPPPSGAHWIEWRFWSNNPIPPTDDACDGSLSVDIGEIHEVVFMFADAAVSFEGGDFVEGLDPSQFHSFRFETLDRLDYTVAVDGRVFINNRGTSSVGRGFLGVSGIGGCTLAFARVNKWDFVRYGTIGFGEQLVSNDPPAGFVDARQHASLDRFTVTFDSANYVYVNDITVETTGGPTPIVTATRRQDNGEPDTVEVVLDRPIPLGETTRFTMTDGVAVNVVEFTHAPGDANGNGKVDLFDAGVLQNCFGVTGPTGLCAVADMTHDGIIDLADHALMASLLDGP